MKKTLCTLSVAVVLGLASYVFAAPAATCVAKIKCNKPYKCEHRANVRDGQPCPRGLAKRAIDKSSMNALDVLLAPAHADHGDLHFGYRDTQNQSGPGASKACEGKLHVCFAGGYQDSGLNPSDPIDTIQECEQVCTTSTTPSQNACSFDDCASRCKAARVPGFGSTCS